MSVVNLATGELLEVVSEQPSETLSQALAALYARQAEDETMVAVLQDELRSRMKADEVESAAFGEYEVTRQINWTSLWDVDALEGVLNDLVEQGVIKAKDAAGVIVQPPRKVGGNEANTLVKRLKGEAQRAVQGCREWQKKEPAKLLVVANGDGPDQKE